MWRIPIILNTLIMCVFAMGSAVSLTPARNHFVQYPEPCPKPLPVITSFVFSNTGIYFAVPVVWVMMALLG